MDLYTGIYNTSGDVRTALTQGNLHKPYMAIVHTPADHIDWNGVEIGPSSGLPSNTFLFNYNAKRFNNSTGVIGKEPGQLFDNDLELYNGAGLVLNNDSISFGFNSYQTYCFSDTGSNPFNRTSADCTFTFIYKTSGYTDGRDNKLFANRRVSGQPYQSAYDCHNYLISSETVFGFDDGEGHGGYFFPQNNPQYIVVRAFADNSGLRQEVDANGNTIQSGGTSFVEWDAPSAGVGFFTGGCNYTGNVECFRSTFYWMYCSNETLTDAEVLQVIRYNDNLQV